MALRGKPGQSKPSDDGADGLKLEFAWDPVKAASNLSKHGVAFDQGASSSASVAG